MSLECIWRGNRIGEEGTEGDRGKEGGRRRVHRSAFKKEISKKISPSKIICQNSNQRKPKDVWSTTRGGNGIREGSQRRGTRGTYKRDLGKDTMQTIVEQEKVGGNLGTPQDLSEMEIDPQKEKGSEEE